MQVVRCRADSAAGNSPEFTDDTIRARSADCLVILAGILGRNPEEFRLRYRDYNLLEFSAIPHVIATAKFEHTVYSFGARRDVIRYEIVTLVWQANSETGNWEQPAKVREELSRADHYHSDASFERAICQISATELDTIPTPARRHNGTTLPGPGQGNNGTAPSAGTALVKPGEKKPSLSENPGKKPKKRRHGRGKK